VYSRICEEAGAGDKANLDVEPTGDSGINKGQGEKQGDSGTDEKGALSAMARAARLRSSSSWAAIPARGPTELSREPSFSFVRDSMFAITM